jgi:hypothetical protein
MVFSSVVCRAQTGYDIDYIKTIGIEVVEIITVNGEVPTCDYIDAPQGSMGTTSTNQNKVPCRIIITLLNDTLYDSGEYQKNVSGATIKINGNTSGVWYNKPYKLKLEKKNDLLTRGDSTFYDKEWRLIKDTYTLNTIIGLKVNELIGMPWTPRYKPCNVFLNGDYQGCYLLIESVKRNKDCRLNVDKQTGYIVERDPYWWNEEKFFNTSFFRPLMYGWTWKYPSEDDVTQNQENYIREYIENAERSIQEGTYEQYIDVESFAKWLMAHDILGTWDSGGSNLYIMKYDDTDSTKLQMCNLWDYDTAFVLEYNDFSNYHDGYLDFYFPQLLSNNNKAFINTYKQLWNDVKDSIFSQLIAFISEYPTTEEGRALQLSRIAHDKRWKRTDDSVSQNAENAIAWLTEHWKFMEKEINSDTKIDYTTVFKHYNNNIYTLDGKKIINNSSLKKGIYIQRGNKYVIN